MVEKQSKPRPRRTVLRGLTKGLPTVAVLGTASGKQQASGPSQQVSRDGGRAGMSVELSKAEPLTAEEIATRIEKRTDREAVIPEEITIGYETAHGSEQNRVTTLGSPRKTTNLEFVEAIDHEYKVKGGVPKTKLAQTYHDLLYYKGVDTVSGQHLNFLWAYDYAKPLSDIWGQHRVDYLFNEINLKDATEELSSMSPGSVQDIDGAWVTTGFNVGAGGTQMGITSETYVDRGEIGPWDDVDYGEGGKGATHKDLDNPTADNEDHSTTYVVRTDSERDGIQQLNANWDTYVYAKA